MIVIGKILLLIIVATNITTAIASLSPSSSRITTRRNNVVKSSTPPPMMAWVVNMNAQTSSRVRRAVRNPYPASCQRYIMPKISLPLSKSLLHVPSHSQHSISTLVCRHMSHQDNENDNSSPNEKESKNKNNNNKLDQILSRLTSLFPFFVLSSATIGMLQPSLLTWVNRGNLITIMLSSVMIGTGMTLEKKDFTNVFASNNKKSPSSYTIIPAGVACQYCIMPLASFIVGTTMLLHAHPTLGKHLYLGLALVGCSPGGTASNLVSLIAGADVALSVLLTTASTILASLITPLLATWLVGSSVAVSGMALCAATTRVVLLPVVAGMTFNKYAPGLSRFLARFTPFASVVLVSLICGGVVAQNAPAVLGVASSTTTTGGVAAAAATTTAISSKLLLTKIITSVLALHTLGFAVGYLLPKFGFKFSEKTSRTISIETGMQNSALAVVLARSIGGADPIASLPGALSATAHSCLGSILAAYWRFVDSHKGSDNDDEESTEVKSDGEDEEYLGDGI